jgi:peptide/nickel transport system permease protein
MVNGFNNHNDSTASESYSRLHRIKNGFGNIVYFLKKNPLAVLGLVILLTILIGALLAPLVTNYSPIKVDIKNKLTVPNLQHLFGTDFLGRDILTRILFGGRNTLTIGLLVVALAFCIGVMVGIFSGFIGGTVDVIIMRIIDAMLSFPALVLAIAFAAALGPSLGNAMLAVAITLMPQFARIARGQALNVSTMLYVESAQSLGASTGRLLFKHILPNSLGPLVVQATLSLGSAILQTASLGFLGLGAQPPTPEWGADVSAGSQFIRESPWVAIYPGLAILLSVLAFNLIGDTLVDWFNPRTRKGN